MTIILHGISNCDTVKKARAWLNAAGIGHVFHDYKKAGIDAAMLNAWVAEVGWEALLNRTGTTFRKLAAGDRADIDQAKAVALMVAHPSMIKRPVVAGTDKLLVGFKPEAYAAAFNRFNSATLN